MKQKFARTMVVLLSLSLLLSILTTFVSLTELSRFEGAFSLLSGAATSSSAGEVNLTISATTSLTNQRTIIDFGSGYVNATCNFCGLDSNGTARHYFANGSNISTAAGAFPTGQMCCVGFTANTLGFLLENTGNVNLSVGYTCSGNCTATTLLGGTQDPSMFGIGIKVASNNIAKQTGESGEVDTVDSCVSSGGSQGGVAHSSGWNISNVSVWNADTRGFPQNTYTTLSNAGGHWLCGNQSYYPLKSDSDQDAGVVDMNITIPAGATGSGVRSSLTITFNGTSAG